MPGSKPKASTNPSIFNALLIYGVFPIALLIAYSFIDESTLGLLKGLQVPKRSIADEPPIIPRPKVKPVAESQKTGHQKRAKEQQQKAVKQRSEPKQRPTNALDEYIAQLRAEHQSNPNDIHKALNLADALRNRDLTVHDGGTVQAEAIKTYLSAVELIITKQSEMRKQGHDIRKNAHGNQVDINEELAMRNEDKSMQGLLVTNYCNLGKQCK